MTTAEEPTIIGTRMMKGFTYTVALALLSFSIGYPLIASEVPIGWFIGLSVQALLYFIAFIKCEKIMVNLYNQMTLMKLITTSEVVKALEEQGLVDTEDKGTNDE